MAWSVILFAPEVELCPWMVSVPVEKVVLRRLDVESEAVSGIVGELRALEDVDDLRVTVCAPSERICLVDAAEYLDSILDSTVEGTSCNTSAPLEVLDVVADAVGNSDNVLVDVSGINGVASMGVCIGILLALMSSGRRIEDVKCVVQELRNETIRDVTLGFEECLSLLAVTLDTARNLRKAAPKKVSERVRDIVKKHVKEGRRGSLLKIRFPKVRRKK